MAGRALTGLQAVGVLRGWRGQVALFGGAYLLYALGRYLATAAGLALSVLVERLGTRRPPAGTRPGRRTGPRQLPAGAPA